VLDHGCALLHDDQGFEEIRADRPLRTLGS
jgi:hypothetical protein